MTPEATTGSGGRQRPWPIAVAVLCGLLMLIAAAGLRPIVTGDGPEYLFMVQAWQDHASPDLRDEDIAAAEPILARNGFAAQDPHRGFFQANNGRHYSWHFWLYPALVVPAKVFIGLVGGNPLAAFQVTNVLLLLLALVVVWPGRERDVEEQFRGWVFVALAACSPVLWYLRWNSAEVFSWAAVMTSLVYLQRGKTGRAALLASLGATQNPPILLLALFILGLAIAGRKRKQIAWTAAAASLSMLPFVFSMLTFGVPNLITDKGMSSLSFVSAARFWSFFLDLNQGVLPYAPVLLVLLGWCLVFAIRNKRRMELGLASVMMGMVLLTATTGSWNCGAAGMLRYAVWILPLLAWIVARLLPLNRVSYLVVLGALASQLLVVMLHDGSMDNDRFRPLARVALGQTPRLYNPVHEIFAERAMGGEGDRALSQLPIPFVRDDGEITKLLADGDSLDRVAELFTVDEERWEPLRASYSERSGLFYVHPPRGLIRLAVPAPDEPSPSPDDVRRFLTVSHVESPAKTDSPRMSVVATVHNDGGPRFWGRIHGVTNALNVGSRVRDASGIVTADSGWTPVPYGLAAGDTTQVTIPVTLPTEPGHYAVDVLPVVDWVAWGIRGTTIQVRVEDGDGYRAVIGP